MKYLLAFALLLISISTLAQTKSFQITGTLVSEESNEPLESATVYLERVKDSTLVTYTISNHKGEFYLQDKTSDERLNLFISYIGHKTNFQEILIDREEINLGTIKMLSDANALEEIVIKSRAPVTIKKDTLEFNVKSFNTKKDATVEDLLKELPGVEVDNEGNITVNGKSVNKILVNGKPFFGDDPTITTRNLTKEIIEKVQITDTKTDAEAFAGEEGDRENKTINLTIDEENNKGAFGRVSAGGGTEERYEYAGLLNLFDNDRRISVLAGGNNTNSPGFSFGEIQKMFGNGRSMMMNESGGFRIDGRSFGIGEGIVTSNNAGANYADELGVKLSVSGDYFYSGSNSDNERATQRENILPESRFFTNSSSKSDAKNDNHSANLRFDIKLDSTFLINVAPSFTFTKAESMSRNSEESLNESNVVTNESSSSSLRESEVRNFSNQLDVTKRFGDRGAFIKLSMTNEFKTTVTDHFLNSETLVFGDTPSEINRDQFTEGELDLNSFFARASYRLPIVSKTFFLDFTYSLRDDLRKSTESTFDFNPDTQGYSDFNAPLSTNFEYTNRRSTPGFRLSYEAEKWSARFGSGYVFRTLESSDQLRPELSLKEEFKALETNVGFNYRFSPQSSTYFGYNLSNTPPQLEQLQPFQDVTDPLNTITGNPNLEPANNHSFYGGFNSFDFQKGNSFYGYVNAGFTNNQVVSKSTIDENFVRNTTYANVDGNFNASISGSYGKTVKIDTVRTLKYRFGAFSNINRNINFNNDVEYASTTSSITPNASVTFTWKEVFEIRPNYRISFTRSKYDIDAFEDQNFLRHTVGIRTATFVPKKFEWRNDIDFNYNPDVADGFQKSAWFWNTTLAYSVLKEQGTLTLKVYDLLNQNTNAQRTSTANYIQDSRSTVLQQYFMLSFSWKFNSLGKKGETRDGNMFFMH